jgi:hypothetical protein
MLAGYIAGQKKRKKTIINISSGLGHSTNPIGVQYTSLASDYAKK